MAQLSPEEKATMQRGAEAKGFLESDFYQKHLAPELKRRLGAELPEPVGDTWQDEYRTIFAITKAVNAIERTMRGWESEYIALKKKEAEPEPDDLLG